jgi:hypothetical protein
MNYESIEEAENTMGCYRRLFRDDGYIVIKDKEYNCILYKQNILGMYIISDESFEKERKNKGGKV